LEYDFHEGGCEQIPGFGDAEGIHLHSHFLNISLFFQIGLAEIDQDGDGQVSKDELIYTLRRWGIIVSDQLGHSLLKSLACRETEGIIRGD
jgi:hypothetical protein